ncbi:unnamed protein product [Effrenium voratum]|uniref:Uncharacterized protein n=1 Tax=Effrenium voratum TaxID=2562239 RepID=A0AA36HTI9_9DINO|nr:unnamed protein product [Effrenium voratum]CAJ1437343.1 unnamed protein product [Effrenium voratum]
MASLWRRRLKHLAALHLRQIPCCHAVVQSLRCFKRSRYQSLGQEEGEEVDKRQNVNVVFGQVMMKVALVAMIAVTILCLVRTKTLSDLERLESSDEWLRFKEDSPIVLYLATVEMLICGSCAVTAAAMYQRRGHQMKHPEAMRCMKVELSKGGDELFGLGFRPSSDGLECLVVEDVRQGSLLHAWNCRSLEPSAEELVEEALGEAESTEKPRPLVTVGSAILAVNDVFADVGLMQQQLLTKSQVTIWMQKELREEVHPSDFDSGMFGADAQPADGGAAPPTTVGAEAPAPQNLPRFACVAMEDEEPQILTRWTICGLMFGWVTLLPVLLMQPHEERPRQQLFRQFLLKPCLLILPVWLLLWILDCVQLLFMFQIIHPFYYFMICHSFMPAILAWYLFTMQAADERVVLDQRRSRRIEAGDVPVVIEDPVPVLLKELIAINPIAMVGLGACASIPIVLCSLFTAFETRRLRQAQSYVNLIYGLLTVLQLVSMYVLYHLRFAQLPEMYLASVYFLVSLPCFAVWCTCLVCANHFAKKDLSLVQSQRLERAKELARKDLTLPTGTLVDCTEAITREFELIYTV